MVESFTESDKVNQVGVGRELGDEEEHFAGRKLPGNPSLTAGKNINKERCEGKKQNALTPPAGAVMHDVEFFK